MTGEQSLYDMFVAAGFATPEPSKPRVETLRDARVATNKKRTIRRKKSKEQHIAILDMETDPFDNVGRDIVLPFMGVLYCDEQEPVIVWEEDYEEFVCKMFAAIEALPGHYTIYAHNGGKFDWLFLISKLRGKVSFKGRGIMSAMIGNHEIRDSFHIIPEKLAAMQKQKFDYVEKLKKKSRAKFKKEIIDYCISDCSNLLYYVRRFIERFGFKISIGAAALAQLREHYEIEHVSQTTDAYLRRYFFGGRVECLRGAGHWIHGQRLYDINSAYPNAMASQQHPVGSEYIVRSGKPNGNTCFITLRCKNNGALMAREEDGSVSTRTREGVFHTTIYEHDMALQLGLISDVEYVECVDNLQWTDFSRFIEPAYARRKELRDSMKDMEKGTDIWNATNADQLFEKLLMNNAYGKTAQDPRHYKEHWITNPGEFPPRETVQPGEDGWKTEFTGANYWIWVRPSQTHRYLNVGTGASITGAVRAKIMHAIHHATNPVYCDTDSIICDAVSELEIDKTKLGAWDLEKEIAELVICGKKLYAYKTTNPDDSPYIKSKGATGLKFEDMLKIFGGENVVSVNFGPTITRTGSQQYLERSISLTAKPLSERKAL